MNIVFNRRYELKLGEFRCMSIPMNRRMIHRKQFNSGNCIMLWKEEGVYLFTGIPVGGEREHYFWVPVEAILEESQAAVSFEEIVSVAK